MQGFWQFVYLFSFFLSEWTQEFALLVSVNFIEFIKANLSNYYLDPSIISICCLLVPKEKTKCS